jgi:activating signal cointegrator 1
MRTMKALSIWQPHASLIAWGLKPYETRGHPVSYRGLIAIHAAKSTQGLEDIVEQTRTLKAQGHWPPMKEGFLRTFHQAVNVYLEVAKIDGFTYNDFPLGAVVATARLAAVYDAGLLHPKLKWPERDFGDFSAGRYAWRLEDVKALPEPIPARGQQGLWDWTPPASFTLDR